MSNEIEMTACSFCGCLPDQHPERRFISSPPVLAESAVICSRCVQTCVKILDNPENWPAGRTEPPPAPAGLADSSASTESSSTPKEAV